LPQQRFVTPDARKDVVFTIAGYDDVWMPSLGYAEDLEFLGGDAVEERDNLRYNAATGTAVLTSGLDAGDSYRIDATVQQPLSAEELRDVGAASVELPPVLGVPDV